MVRRGTVSGFIRGKDLDKDQGGCGDGMDGIKITCLGGKRERRRGDRGVVRLLAQEGGDGVHRASYSVITDCGVGFEILGFGGRMAGLNVFIRLYVKLCACNKREEAVRYQLKRRTLLQNSVYMKNPPITAHHISCLTPYVP